MSNIAVNYRKFEFYSTNFDYSKHNKHTRPNLYGRVA